MRGQAPKTRGRSADERAHDGVQRNSRRRPAFKSALRHSEDTPRDAGVFVQFTESGYAELLADSKLECFSAFVDAMRDGSSANAFVLNVVSASPNGDGDVIEYHMDQSLGLSWIQPPGHLVANLVDVL